MENRFVWERRGISLSCSSCPHWLHRVGFGFKRPKKRLLKADEARREAFVVEYATLMEEACQSQAKVFFADEAHFRADAELRGKWVLRGEPALVDSSRHWWTRAARGTGRRPATIRRCAWRPVRWNGWTWKGTATAKRRPPSSGSCGKGPPCGVHVIWDNAPAHRGEAVREYLRRPGLNPRLVNLPGYSPDLNADEAIWGWAREEATGNLCLGTREAVLERVSSFMTGLASRKDEVRRRCRTVLQSRAEALV